MPATVDITCLWLAHLHGNNILFSTIRNYLCALRSAHTDLALECSIGSSKLIERVYRGIKRTQGEAASIRPRFPVTFEVLRAIDPLFILSRADHRLFRAAMWTATAGLFRIGELVVDSASNPEHQRLLLVRDLREAQMDPPVVTIHLKRSKTDVFRKEVDVKIANLTAIDALDSYLAERKLSLANDQPLFAFDDGTPLTRSKLLAIATSMIKSAGIDMSKYSGLSFRRGGATSLSAAGTSDRLVKIIGRWKGWSYARYIETPIKQIIDASANL